LITRLLDHCVSQSIHCPYPVVPISTEQFLPNYSKWHICRKYISRIARPFLLGQLGRRVSRIPIGTRVIWIQVGKANLGDVLMELSGRQLFKGLNVSIDLYTLPQFKPLFENDTVFRRVLSEGDCVSSQDYDFALLTEFNHPSTYAKARRFFGLPYACLFGFFRGPDRNQTLFSHAAVNDVFQLGHTDAQLLAVARPFLEGSRDDTSRTKLNDEVGLKHITIGVGGIDPRRTYRRWPEVLNHLNEALGEGLIVTLLGSQNGADMAKQLLAARADWRLKLTSKVGSLSLLESRDAIVQSHLFAGCDGGLLHLAHTTGRPTVSLFSREAPRLRLSPACGSDPIQDPDDINRIEPSLVAQKIISKLG
jgi:hypothetical protein